MVKELLKETDPFLREKTIEFDFENPPIDPEKLKYEIKETLEHHNALGLAANQIGYPYSVFGMRMFKGHNDSHFVMCFNPEIQDVYEEYELQKEGCLSFPDLYIDISRPKGTTSLWRDEKNNVQAGILTNINARIFLHEFDHTNGIVFTEKASTIRLSQANKKRKIYYRQQKKGKI